MFVWLLLETRSLNKTTQVHKLPPSASLLAVVAFLFVIHELSLLTSRSSTCELSYHCYNPCTGVCLSVCVCMGVCVYGGSRPYFYDGFFNNCQDWFWVIVCSRVNIPSSAGVHKCCSLSLFSFTPVGQHTHKHTLKYTQTHTLNTELCIGIYRPTPKHKVWFEFKTS